MGHHMGKGSARKITRKIVKLVDAIARTNDQAAKVKLYRLLEADEVLSVVDNVLESLQERAVPIEPYLNSYLVFLLRRSIHRGPVKFAIALLGAIRDEDAIQPIRNLGLHEEFTLYTAVALSNYYEDPEIELWELAKKVDGWGRIQLVEQLADARNSDIRNWILRDGFRNSIMYEYLAYLAATTGDLKRALSKGFVDEELLIAASEIISALIAGGPAEDMSCYCCC